MTTYLSSVSRCSTRVDVVRLAKRLACRLSDGGDPVIQFGSVGTGVRTVITIGTEVFSVPPSSAGAVAALEGYLEGFDRGQRAVLDILSVSEARG